MSTTTATVSTVTSRMTPVVTPTFNSEARNARVETSRRRTSSEGENTGAAKAATDAQERDKLFRSRMQVASRSKVWSQNITTLIEKIKSTAAGHSMRWAEEEIKVLQKQLEDLEVLESGTWSTIGKLEGLVSQENAY